MTEPEEFQPLKEIESFETRNNNPKTIWKTNGKGEKIEVKNPYYIDKNKRVNKSRTSPSNLIPKKKKRKKTKR
jgi:hypothetical protein